MLLAVSALSPTSAFICYFVAFVAAIVLVVLAAITKAWHFFVLGVALTFFIFVFMWDALAQT